MEENYPNEIGDDGVVKGEEKVEKGRERNREHAKRTRIKKKAVLDGMKGKLLDLQNEASRLQQALEERNTANILIHLCSRSAASSSSEDSTSFDDLKAEPTEFDPLRKGNIIQQLRTKVRSEAAEKNQIAALLSSRNDSVSSISDSCTFTNYDSDYDSDNDGEDAFQSLHETMNWKDGTVVSKEGSKSKISDEELEILRKERNRVHAKLTRDRKKIFTSRMTQMISSLETQNGIMKNSLKSLPTVEDSLLSGKICDTLRFSESEICHKRKHSDIDQESRHQESSIRQRNPIEPPRVCHASNAIMEESKRNENFSSISDLSYVLGPLHKLNRSISYPSTVHANLGLTIEPLNRHVSDSQHDFFRTNHLQTVQNDPDKFLGPLRQIILKDSNTVQIPLQCSYHCSSATVPDCSGAL